ncbi:MAG: peptidoglycan DD-metalloendopeptidase family protein [Rhodobacteraceae bacterium]|nr:peptidoglycan DD-metalloendopeptidase family protein [Paracoccaceae bacterium]
MRAWAVIAAAALLAAPARAEDPAAAAARAAADGLRATIAAMREAGGARDRIAVLTQTIGAYEDGLALLRESLRRLDVRERELTGALDARRDDLSRVTGAMIAIGSAPDELLLLHPQGPEATVEAALVLGAVAPALQAEADRLKATLRDLAAIRGLRQEALATLQEGLDAAEEARTALGEAMSDRAGMPRRFLDDPEELKALVAAADTLDAFAAGIAAMESDIGPPRQDFAAARGSLPLPVRGTLLRRSGEADAAGIVRPGLVIAAAAEAIVTAPWPATIRYRGPLLDYGNVMVLEPATGYLLVLAGLGTVYGETGDVVAAGTPVGLMPGGPAGGTAAPEEPGGAGRAETLYLELRLGGEPVDPGPWFRETREM